MSTRPEPTTILDLIEAFRRSKTMFTAVRFGVFDRLELQPQSSANLANEIDADESAVARLLDGCVSLGLLVREGQTYRNTPISSRYLVSASADTLAGYITYSDQSLYLLWSHLDDAIRENGNRWAQTFGSRDALFDHYFRDETATRSFLGGMHGFGQITSPNVVRAFDLSRFTHLVDLGGATGHLGIAACEAYPNLRATVFDLPRIEPFARDHIRGSAVADRVKFVPGDFFAGKLPQADLYALGRILHDWGEQKIAALLSKIFEALPPGGALLIAETLVDEDRSGPVYARMQDLNMLVCTDGRERTPGEYRVLLESAGFANIEFRRTGLLLDAVLASKA